MNDITNDKIDGLLPTWKKFFGFSLLFDQLGDQNYQKEQGRITRLANRKDSPHLGFYLLVHQILAELVPQLPSNDYLFCPLSFSSFHVTVWDGVNDGNLDGLKTSYQEYFREMFGAFPNSLAEEVEAMITLLATGLTQKENWGIKMKFKAIKNFKNNALVILLEPADDQSEAALHEIRTLRRILNRQFQQEVGESWAYVDQYLPHLSLGYFANTAYGEKSRAYLEYWETTFQQAFQRAPIEQRTITFETINLYGFTDMINFFKFRI